MLIKHAKIQTDIAEKKSTNADMLAPQNFAGLSRQS
jgi:hypothetical protein